MIINTHGNICAMFFAMIPVKPTSVKYPPDQRQSIKDNANLLGYTFGHYIRECAKAIDKMADEEEPRWPPMVISLRLARERQAEMKKSSATSEAAQEAENHKKVDSKNSK